MEQEQQTETELQWLEPSNVGADYLKHEEAMQLCRKVPVHKAFALAPGFNVGMLRRIAEGFKPKKIVVVDHAEFGFEVLRLADSADTKLFYESISKGGVVEKPQLKEKKDEVIKVIKRLFEDDLEKISKYDAKADAARQAGCVPYTYINRRAGNVAAFRNDGAGQTEALKQTLIEMENEGLLRKLAEDEAQELFKSSAVFYRVNRGAL